MNKKNIIIVLIISIFILICNLISVLIYRKTAISMDYTYKNSQIAKKYINSTLEFNTIEKNYKGSMFSWDLENYNDNNFLYYNAFVMFALLKTNSGKLPKDFYDYIITSNGDVNNSVNSANTAKHGELDTVFIYYPMYFLPKVKKYSLAIEKAYQLLSKQDTLEQCGGNYVHKLNNSMWSMYPFSLDGLFMALPFILKHDKNYNEISKRLDWVNKNMRLSNGLYSHGADFEGNPNNIVWLRGVCWYGMLQMEILDISEDEVFREKIKKQLNEFLDGMLKYQDYKTGMWRNVIYPKVYKCNKFETSGTLMMAYLLLKAYSKGYVTDKKYLYAGMRAYNGVMYNNFSEKNIRHLNNIYLSSNVKNNPQEYCVCEKYISDEAKGFAPLILATYAVEKVFKMK